MREDYGPYDRELAMSDQGKPANVTKHRMCALTERFGSSPTRARRRLADRHRDAGSKQSEFVQTGDLPMPKHVPEFPTAIDLLTYVREAVVRSPRCRPLDYINRLEERKGTLIACASETREILIQTRRRLYPKVSILQQAQRLNVIDTAIADLRAAAPEKAT
jgi:hypothetical protein